MNLLKTTLASTTAVVLTMAAAAPAFAQQLEEITVTARKVEENLMTVPIAITAFSSKDIDAMGVKSMNDIAQMTPSFNFVNQQGGSGRNDRSSNSLTFRGLYVNNNAGTSAGGLLFVDGTPVIGAQPPSVSDVERVEVLKGPQSAYFGRSTFMGAINFVMREPNMTEYKGRISAEYASFGSNEETLSFEGPIVEDKLAARISGRYWKRGGQYTNALNTSQKLGEQTTKSVSASFVAKPTDSLKVKAFLNYFADSDGTPAQTTISTSPPNNASAFNCAYAGNTRSAGGYFCGELPTIDKLNPRLISQDSNFTPALQAAIYDNTPGIWKLFDPRFLSHFGLERRAFQADLRIDYETESGWSFSSVTAYHRDKNSTMIDSTYIGDGDQPNLLYTPGVAPGSTYQQNFTYMRLLQGLSRDWSQEVRVASPQKERLRGTIGFSYLNAASPGGTVYGLDVRVPALAASITRSRLLTPAVFGGVYFDILDNLTISGEARYQWDRVKQIPYVGAAGTLLTGAAAGQLANTFKSFSPRVSLDWKFAPNSTAYVLFSRGYRPGGFNAALSTSPADVIAALRAAEPNAGATYLQEQLDNFEAGIKGTFLDGRARATLSVYYDKYKNGQAGASIPVRTATVSNIFNITINSASATLKGYELEGEFQVTDQFKLSGSMALNDSKISTSNFALYNCTDCNNILGNAKLGLGNRLPTTPKWMWTATAQYQDHLAGDYDWFTRVDYSHRGMNFTDFSAATWVGASDNVNARIGVRNEVLSIEGFVTNLTQNRVAAAALTGVDVYSFAFAAAPAPFTTVQKNAVRMSLPIPRMFGIRASYNF